MKLTTMLPLFCGLLVAAAGCKKDTPPTPEPAASAPSAVASASASASTPASAPASLARVAPVASGAPEVREGAKVPTLVVEPWGPAIKNSWAAQLFAVKGALLVTADERIGRVVDDRIDWFGKVPKPPEAYGFRIINKVSGRWPDGIDVLYQNSQGRVAEPTYFPLTGKGKQAIMGPGGGFANIEGPAVVGESTVIYVRSNSTPDSFFTVRGPQLPHKMTVFTKGGCTKENAGIIEVARPFPPAVTPDALGSTEAGTLIAIGKRCGKTVAAEVWSKDGKTSRIVELTEHIPQIGYPTGFIADKDDALWFYSGGSRTILRYQDGEFSHLPLLPTSLVQAFASDAGVLHAHDGQTIHRFQDGAWSPVGRAPWPGLLRDLASVQGTFWLSTGDRLARLKEGPGVDWRDDCATPFVYLRDVKFGEANTFPTLRKPLAAFPEAEQLELVEFSEQGSRLGVTVTSQAQGEALIAHLKQSEKFEPRLVCYAPNKPRKVAIKK